MPDVTDLTDPRMLRTVAGLRQWITDQLEQHQPRGDERCSCGWVPPPPEPGFVYTHQEHVDSIVLSDVGDVLPSDSSTGTGTNINGVTVEPVTHRKSSWREEVEHLMWVIERKNEELGQLRRNGAGR